MSGFHETIYTLHLADYALGHTFRPKKASHKFGIQRKMVLRPTFSLYEIDPRSLIEFRLLKAIYNVRKFIGFYTSDT